MADVGDAEFRDFKITAIVEFRISKLTRVCSGGGDLFTALSTNIRTIK